MWRLPSIQFPDIYKKLSEFPGAFFQIVNQWFSTMFFIVLPKETVFRIWDLIFYEGIGVMFEYALKILALFRKKILHCKDYIQLMLMFNEKTQAIFDFSLLSKIVLNPRIKNGDIKILRNTFRQRLAKAENVHSFIV